jgi:membrane associated rhomboid family serine protease
MHFSNLAIRWRTIAAAKGTWGFVLLILLIQAAVELTGGPNRVAEIYLNFGLSRDGVLGGKIWQLGTYGLLHGHFFHVALNSVWVLLVGSRVEQILGPAAVWKALVAGIAGGGIAHLVVAAGGESAPLLVGASGGCMALLILLSTLSPDSRMWPVPVSAKNLALGVMITALILTLVDPALGLPGFSALGNWLQRQGLGGWFAVGHACHFGGGLAGFLLGRWLLRPRVTAARLRRDRERREAGKVR